VAARTASAVAVLLVWFSLVFPDQIGRLAPGALLRIPVEGILLVALALFLPAAPRWVLAVVVGLGLGLLAVLKIVDMGFFTVLGRPFSPVTDWGYLGSAVGLLRDSVGRNRTVAAVGIAVLLLIAVLVVMIWSVLRLSRITTEHRASSAWTVSALAAVWLLCAALGVQVAGGPVASTAAAGLTQPQTDEVLTVADPFATTQGSDLLTGLRGRDVLVVFVESYGRVAVQDSSFSPAVDALLTRGTKALAADGFSSRSAFLTSPTYAGISWLAHSTLQSGLWIDTQLRYNQLLQTDRLTLSAAFKRAGWRTVADVPANTEDWPQGMAFYHYDHVYDCRNVGYAGPGFGYATMPDQYTLAAFQRNELSQPNHPPVMAEIDLVTSHGPWAPLPRMVDWKDVGNGSVFADMPAQGKRPEDLLGHPVLIQAAYAESIRYSMEALMSFVQTFHDDNLVVIALGDHQPAAVVSGPDASRDVPITIIAHDPEVMSRIESWGWQPGMLPNLHAPVWPMDAFRDRFLTAYGPQQAMPPASASPTPR
jgi:hypothetical protein